MPTKVHLVKAMVFPVVMYGCERWTIKKAIELDYIYSGTMYIYRERERESWTLYRELDYKEELMLLNCGVEEDS